MKPGKSPGLDSIIPEFILHAESALKSEFCDVFTSCMRQLKIPKIWRKALIIAIPKSEKPLGYPKSYRPVSLLCVHFKILERPIVSNQSSTHCSHSSRRASETGGRPWTRSPCWHRTSRIAFRLRRRPELCLSTSQQPKTLYGTVTSPET